MDGREWDQLADELKTVWPKPQLTPWRREVYYEALADLDRDAVCRAIMCLLQGGRETLPPPGVLRQWALPLSQR
jgi:hypothetical protein